MQMSDEQKKFNQTNDFYNLIVKKDIKTPQDIHQYKKTSPQKISQD